MQNRTIGNDFERTRRQRDVIIAVTNKILKEKTPTEMYDIVDYAFGLIKTNIPATDLVSYAASVLGKTEHQNPECPLYGCVSVRALQRDVHHYL